MPPPPSPSSVSETKKSDDRACDPATYDYTARVELELYRLINEMIKDKTVTENRTIIKVLKSQAKNIFVDELYFQIRTVLRTMKLNNFEEMTKAALEEEQALENFKTKSENTNTNMYTKP
ncbi:hypothetical protein QTP88_028405 [Uroleucon formosanum]